MSNTTPLSTDVAKFAARMRSMADRGLTFEIKWKDGGGVGPIFVGDLAIYKDAGAYKEDGAMCRIYYVEAFACEMQHEHFAFPVAFCEYVTNEGKVYDNGLFFIDYEGNTWHAWVVEPAYEREWELREARIEWLKENPFDRFVENMCGDLFGERIA